MDNSNNSPIIQWLNDTTQVKDWSNFIPEFSTLPDKLQIKFLRTIMECHKNEHKKITRGDFLRLITPSRDINIGIYFIIKILLHLKDHKSFPTWNDLYGFFKEITPDINSHKILSLDEGAGLFDRCTGRYTLNWYNDNYSNDDIAFSIRIKNDYSSKISILPTKDKNTWRHRLSLIKYNIPSCQYNVETRTWNADPSAYMNVVQFAKEQQVILRWENDAQHSYCFNLRYNTSEPFFCEGRHWENKHKKLPVWWCYGAGCYENNIHLHNKKDEYTLYDFIYILKLQDTLQYKDTKGYTVPDGNYVRFMSILNWFNQAQTHLFCKECGKILEPYYISDFHAHTITEFECINPVCCQKNNKIYLNHCFNGECHNIIDSRETKQCPNGKYICKSCGVCCSSYMFRNKTATSKFQSLHWENQEFYCPICGEKLVQVADKYKHSNTYKCFYDNYEIKIDSRKYTKALNDCIKKRKYYKAICVR